MKPTEMLDTMYGVLEKKCQVRGDLLRTIWQSYHTACDHPGEWELCQRDPCQRVREALAVTEP
jgi:hypothetical protein